MGGKIGNQNGRKYHINQDYFKIWSRNMAYIFGFWCADGCIYKLLEYGLIEESGKADLPGKPMTYKTTDEFLKMFGYSSLNDLPELPKYKLDSNQQIVIDELVEK